MMYGFTFKGSQRPCIAKRTMNVKKVMHAISITNQGPDIQIAVPKNKFVKPSFFNLSGMLNFRSLKIVQHSKIVVFVVFLV